MPSKFGGVPVSSDSPKSKFGGVPVNDATSSKENSEKPDSTLVDVGKSLVGGIERGAAAMPMVLPNLLNQVAAGPQLLGRGVEEGVDKLIGIEPQPHGELWEPFFSSEEFLQSMPGALRPHEPKTAAGSAMDLAGQMIGGVGAGKGIQSLPKTLPKAADAIKSSKFLKSEASGGKTEVQKQISAEDKANAYIAKAMLKAGHSPDEIVDIMGRAKRYGMTAGEAAKNPKMLGLESKISGMNRPGGETMRTFARDRVDPNYNISVQERLQAMADPLLKNMKDASTKIQKLVTTSPKTPINMAAIKDSLIHEGAIPGTPAATTIKKINEYMDWAKSQGDTFGAWHKVKQHIWDLKSEAKNPSAPEKLDIATVKKYYKKINDVLSRRTPGLPQELEKTGSEYAVANDRYRQNLAGKTISEIVKKAPTGGTPSATLNYLYKKLAGSPAEQEKLFGQMPVATQKGMMKLLEAIKDMGRANLRDVSKSVEDGSAAFPKTKHSAIHKLGDMLIDMITKKDYDALAKAFTNPDVEEIARKIGYRNNPSAKEISDIIEESAGTSLVPKSSTVPQGQGSEPGGLEKREPLKLTIHLQK